MSACAHQIRRGLGFVDKASEGFKQKDVRDDGKGYVCVPGLGADWAVGAIHVVLSRCRIAASSFRSPVHRKCHACNVTGAAGRKSFRGHDRLRCLSNCITLFRLAGEEGCQ
jgi:hypothetical protein